MSAFVREHIAVGALLHYSGSTSMSGWDCYARVHRVEGERFWVTSLDDMREQRQAYSIEVGQYAPRSRRTMQPVERADVVSYLEGKQVRLAAHMTEEHTRHAQAVCEIERVEAAVTALLADLNQPLAAA